MLSLSAKFVVPFVTVHRGDTDSGCKSQRLRLCLHEMKTLCLRRKKCGEMFSDMPGSGKGWKCAAEVRFQRLSLLDPRLL